MRNPVPSSVAADTGAAVVRFDLALGALISGLEVVIRHATGALIADVATAFVDTQRDLRTQLRSMAAPRGWLGKASVGLASGKLRWEWIASTGTTLDGSPDRRLLTECVVAGERLSEATDRLALVSATDRDLHRFVALARERIGHFLDVTARQLADGGLREGVSA